jgi:hypothetical protein
MTRSVFVKRHKDMDLGTRARPKQCTCIMNIRDELGHSSGATRQGQTGIPIKGQCRRRLDGISWNGRRWFRVVARINKPERLQNRKWVTQHDTTRIPQRCFTNMRKSRPLKLFMRPATRSSDSRVCSDILQFHMLSRSKDELFAEKCGTIISTLEIMANPWNASFRSQSGCLSCTMLLDIEYYVTFLPDSL